MNESDYKIAKELKERLLESVSLVDFQVFGSRAKGRQEEYSDMDIFIELESLDKEIEDKIFNIGWEVGFEHSLFISPILFTRYEIENSALKVSPIVKNIKEEGIRI